MNTAVMNTLDSLGVSYAIKEHRMPALTCETAASERGVRISQIVKCMIGETDESHLVVMLIPGNRTLKSSKARKRLKVSGLTLVHPERLADDLGLTVGAISPVQLIGQAVMLMDPSVLDEEIVDISSGDPLAGIELRSRDLQEVLAADLVDIVSLH